MSRIFIFFISLVFLTFATMANEHDDNDDDFGQVIKLIAADNFYQDAKLASTNNQTLVVMFSSESCSFCETLAVEILRPMQIGQKDSNYIIRRVEVDAGAIITNFNNQQVTMSEFVDKYDIAVTPTLIFFDHNGIESAQRIVGANGIELLSYYIDSSIDLVNKKIANTNNL